MKRPTTILAMMTLFALLPSSGTAAEVQALLMEAMEKRPSDGAFFAALRKLCDTGYVTKTEADTPTYTITRTGTECAQALSRQVLHFLREAT